MFKLYLSDYYNYVLNKQGAEKFTIKLKENNQFYF